MAGVHRIPVLCARDSPFLSKEFEYIIKHRSGRLLGTLKRGWSQYESQVNVDISLAMQSNKVLLENGSRCELRATFLPLPRLKKIAAELQIPQMLPFVAVSQPLRDEERVEWMFLQKFRVRLEDDWYFYVRAVQSFKKNNIFLSTASVGEHLIRMYHNIQSKCNQDLSHVRYVHR